MFWNSTITAEFEILKNLFHLNFCFSLRCWKIKPSPLTFSLNSIPSPFYAFLYWWDTTLELFTSFSPETALSELTQISPLESLRISFHYISVGYGSKNSSTLEVEWFLHCKTVWNYIVFMIAGIGWQRAKYSAICCIKL